MGTSYIHAGDLEKGNSYYYKALQYCKDHLSGKDRYLAIIYANLSDVQYWIGNYTQSLHYARAAIDITQNANEVSAHVGSLINMGVTYLKLNYPDSALACFTKGRLLAQAEGLTDMEQSILTNIGNVMMQKGLPQKAIPFYKEALQLGEATHPLYSNIHPGYALSMAYFKAKDYKHAEQVLLQSMQKAKYTGLTLNTQQAHRTLADIYEATGRYQQALKHRHIQEQIKDSLTGIEKTRAITEI